MSDLSHNSPVSSPVLVTGGNGFLGGWIVASLLGQGHHVRATVRDTSKVDLVAELVRAAGIDPDGRLETVVATLDSDEGWAEAMTGVEYVHHVASPFQHVSRDEGEALIRSAQEGAVRVLTAARGAGVRRVVLTSSYAAIGYSPKRGSHYDETDWTSPEDAKDPYIRSKVLAERAAWDLVTSWPDGPELTVINPTGIFGPVLGGRLSSSVGVVSMILSGELPALPRMHFGIVDVRDAAQAHISAMTTPEAAGRRILAVSDTVASWGWVIDVLRNGLDQTISTRETGEATAAAPTIDNTLAKKILGLSFRSAEETVLDTARSIAERVAANASRVL